MALGPPQPGAAGNNVTGVIQARAGQPGSGTHLDAAGNVVDDATGQIVVYADGTTGQDHLSPEERAQLQAENSRDPLGDLVVNTVTKNNPIAGTVRAGIDVGKGDYKGAVSDFVGGTSYGTTPQLKDGQLVPGDTTAAAADLVGLPEGIPGVTGPVAVPDIPGLLSPNKSDTTGLNRITDKALSTQDALTSRYQSLEANPTKAPQSDLVQLDQSNIDPLRQRQTTALDQLQAAADGRVPSAAEILGRDQANRAAAQAYGNAAALQGGNSSGGTLRQALDAGTQLQGDANTQLIAARAKEMSDARGQLVQGLAGARGQESADATTNANLDQNKNLANTTAAVTTHGQDVSEKGDLISGQNTALGIGEQSEKAKVDADTANAASANALKGAEIAGVASAIPVIAKSDRRAKTDIRSVDLVQLAEDIPGHTWDYKDPADGRGRRVGIVAQDAQRSRLGRQLVRLGDDGDLVLDGPNSVGAALAMSAEALRKAEAARRGRR